MHAVPIHKSAIVQTAPRTTKGAKRAATIATFGTHHASALVRTLASQSREVLTVSLAMRSSRTTRALRLNWGTPHRAKRTEHTTIARLRPECRAAAATFVEELAGVGRHSFHLGRAAARASDEGFEDYLALLDCHRA